MAAGLLFLLCGLIMIMSRVVSAEFTCGDNVISLNASRDSAALFSPNYPNVYSSNMTCGWRITADNERDRIYLRFVMVDLENRNKTCNDKLIVYDGYNDSATELRRWCGNQDADVTLKSSNNTVYVVFTSDADGAGRGFAIHYTADQDKICYGQTYDLADATHIQTSSVVKIPYFKDQPKTAECLFRIKAAKPDYQIRITIFGTSFDVTNTCNGTSMVLYDGYAKDRHTLGNFCGYSKDSEATFTTSGRYLLMELVTGSGDGIFKLDLKYHQYKAVAMCRPWTSLIATYDTQTMTSPNFPNDYGLGLNCSYLIHTDDDENIYIHIEPQLPANCSDKVKVYDGNSTTSQVIGEVCGNTNMTFNSSTRQLLVIFKTDSQFNTGGFRMQYRNQGNKSVVSTCGDRLNASRDAAGLFSPNYPNLYPSNMTCGWRITADNERDRIYLRFVMVDLENRNKTCNDNIVVYDGYNDSAKELRRWCGNQDADVTLKSSNNTVYVEFTSDGEGAGRGFAIHYVADQDKICYGQTHDLADATHIPTSYKTNIPYYKDQPRTGECLFRIKASEPNFEVRINISGNNFGSNFADSCSESYLVLYDGSSKADHTLGTFCGNTERNQVTFTTSGRYLFMELVTGSSDGIVNLNFKYDQFKAVAMCRPWTNLIATYDMNTMTSPNFPKVYGLGLNCSYLIHTDDDENIYIHIEPQLPANCSDKLVVYDGNSTRSEVIGEVCGNTNMSFNSSSRQLLVIFQTDSLLNTGGFRMLYRNVGSNPIVFEIPEQVWPIIVGIVLSVNFVAAVLLVIAYIVLRSRNILKNTEEMNNTKM